MMWIWMIMLWALASPAWSATFYISPTGSNADAGTDRLHPWKTFAYALDASRASCGDTLVLLDGTYGIGTGTGYIDIANRLCGQGNELLIAADNQRQAKILDDGGANIVAITSSSGIIVDGLYLRSADKAGVSTSVGRLFRASLTSFVKIINSLLVNPNRYNNNHPITFDRSTDGLAEDNEVYIFGRHCTSGGSSERIVIRRVYCNPRGGKIPGGFSNGGMPDGSGDTLMTMYPCKDCIQENTIADCTTNPMLLNEMNADYNNSTLMSGSKVLGSIAYNCSVANAIYPNARKLTTFEYSPTNFLVQDVVLADWKSDGQGVKCEACVGATINRLTILGVPSATTASGVQFKNDPHGLPPAQHTGVVKNSVITGLDGVAFQRIVGVQTGTHLIAFGNATNFSPSLPGPWGTTMNVNPGYGTCKGIWVPDGAPGKGAGDDGGDIGANVLYQYRDGVLHDGTGGTAKIPLWSPTSGEFPHGAADPDGVNRVPGQSLFDIHSRLNINTGGCPFPASYLTGGGPSNPSTHVSSNNTTGPHVHVIDPGMASVVVAVAAWDGSGAVGYATDMTDTCGNTYAALPDAASDTGPWFTDPTHRSLRVFGKLNPTAGTCTFTPAFTGEVDGWNMVSIERAGVSSFRPISWTYGFSNTPGVTVPTNPDETVVDFLVTSPSYTLTAGPDQTLTKDERHPTLSLRLATSEQSGALGGVMTDTLTSGAVRWVIAGLSYVPESPGTPGAAVITQTKSQIYYGYGTEATVAVKSPINTPATIGLISAARVRFEVTGSVENTPEFGAALYCRLDADPYTRVVDALNGKAFRFFGAGVEAESSIVLASGTTLTIQKLSGGSLEGGIFSRDETFVPIVPSLEVSEHYEVEYEVAFESAAEATAQCRIQKDNGDLLVYPGGTEATFHLRKGAASVP